MDRIIEATENLEITDVVSGQSTPIAASSIDDKHVDESGDDDESECDVHFYYIQIRNANDYRVIQLFVGDDGHADDIIYAAWDNRCWAVISYCEHHADEHIEPLRQYGFVIYTDEYFRDEDLVEVDNDEDFRLVDEQQQCESCARKGVYAPMIDHAHSSAEGKSD